MGRDDRVHRDGIDDIETFVVRGRVVIARRTRPRVLASKVLLDVLLAKLNSLVGISIYHLNDEIDPLLEGLVNVRLVELDTLLLYLIVRRRQLGQLFSGVALDRLGDLLNGDWVVGVTPSEERRDLGAGNGIEVFHGSVS